MGSIDDRPLRIAVGVGHVNAGAGDPYELRKNREVVAALLALARSPGVRRPMLHA